VELVETIFAVFRRIECDRLLLEVLLPHCTQRQGRIRIFDIALELLEELEVFALRKPGGDQLPR
jgi:hypothetical protein